MISDDILKYSGSFKNIIDQCNFIKSEFNSGMLAYLRYSSLVYCLFDRIYFELLQ